MKVRLALLLLGVVVILSGCLFQNIPRAEFTSTPSSGYPPLEVDFDASASSSPNGPIVSYAWAFGDGETDTGVEVPHTFYEKGVYSVTLTVTDSAGKVGSRTRNVQALNYAPEAKFEYMIHRVTMETEVWFDASESSDPDGYIADYIWDFGDGTVISTSEDYIEHTFLPDGRTEYQVRLTVVDEDGDSDPYTQTIDIGCCGS